jgi:hypothetical protein
VEAVNDGKQAAWYMHKYLQALDGIVIPDVPALPAFYTRISPSFLDASLLHVLVKPSLFFISTSFSS